MKSRTIGIVLLAATIVAGCSQPKPRTEAKPAAAATKVTGTVFYRERMALPSGTSVEVLLVDQSRGDAPMEVLGTARLSDPGQPPIRFEIPFDPARIDSTHSYSVRAEISFAGKLQFRSDSATPVLTHGSGRDVSVLVRRVDAGAPAPLEMTWWRLATVGGTDVPTVPGAREIDFRLDPAGHGLTGFGGCNRFRGSYTTTADSLRFGGIMATKMACANTMDVENAYLAALASVTTFRIDGRELGLFDGTGTRVLRFEAREKPY